MENLVRLTTLKVIKKAKDVKINQEKIRELTKNWLKKGIALPPWPKKFHLQTKNKIAMLDYLIILDSLNFCFWSERKKRWQIDYGRKKYNGYFALSLNLKKFFEENPKKANLNYFAIISFKEFILILQGGKNLLFLKKRWQIVRVVSQKIFKKYGSSEKFVSSAKHKFSILISKIYKELPYFVDIGRYGGKKIYFLKRAQILCSDIWGAFGGKGIGHFEDLDYLTAFADYKVPQILHQLGILEYSPSLEKKIKNKIIIPAGSKQEVEIRSATIWAVEYLTKELNLLGKNFCPFQVDWILWNKSQSLNKLRIPPYHLTKTIYY